MVRLMNFYQLLSKYYDTIFPLNNQSISFITEKISDGPILDIAAGTGNHAIALAKLGYEVTATDLDENMVDKINKKATTNHVTVQAVKLAMEQLSQLSETKYKSIICIGNSLVHLQSFNDVLNALKTMNELLVANGKIIIQIVNYDRVLSNKITELPLIEREEVTFNRNYEHKDGKIIFIGQLTVGENAYENAVELLPLTSSDIEKLLTDAGFHSINLYGSFKGEKFTSNSPALIVEASK